jgi:dTMP kinase
MLVAFEGIDGSGKTTVSNRVAEALRDEGLTVEHLREGGTFHSHVTQSIRELGRDARNLSLTPYAELLLYLAREVQLLEESLIPALGQADVIIADRFFASAEVLARYGRGLPADEVTAIVRQAGHGVAPDLVILVDVDPHIARARRRVSRIEKPDGRPPSRKGLGGAGMGHRLRAGYRELAARDHRRWVTIDNTEAPLGQVVAEVLDVIRAARRDGAVEAVQAARARAPRPSPTPPLPDAAAALDAFLAWLDRRVAVEPALCAHALAGLAGPGVDQRRRALAPLAPLVLADGLRGQDDPVSWALRAELEARAPAQIAASLAGAAAAAAAAWGLRERLAQRVPAEVAGSVAGLDDEAAWSLRDRLYPRVPDAVVGSLRRVGGDRAWALRRRWIDERRPYLDYDGARVAAASIGGLDDDLAWEVRRAALAQAPVAALASLTGLTSERAWSWRTRFLDRAPRVVLRTLDGLEDERAYALREAAADTAKESLDSLVGLDGERAWGLRWRLADVWPSTAVKSLGPLAATPRGAALLTHALARHAGDLSLLKHAAAIALGAGLVHACAEEE